MDENAITTAICAFLDARGWCIEQRERTRKYHVDVVASDPVTGRRCFVEVAGGTSSKPDSARHGQGFTPSQIAAHVARVVLVALKVRSEYPHDVVVAVPDERYHRSHLDAASTALHMAGVDAWFVAENGSASAHWT